MTASSRTTGLVVRHLRTGAGGPVTVAALVFVLTVLAVLTPPATVALLDASIRFRLEALSPPVRDLSTSVPTAPWPGRGSAPSESLPEQYAATWGLWDSALRQVRATAPEEIRDVHAEADYYTRLGAPGMYVGTTYVVLDPRYASRIDIVDGRLPEPSVTPPEWETAFLSLLDPESFRPLEPPPGELPATEIVLSVAAAEREGWQIGETRIVGPESRWRLPLPLTLSGTFEALDETDPYWSRASGLLQPFVGSDPDGVPYVRTTAFASPEVLQTVPAVAGAGHADAWYAQQFDRVTTAAASELLAELRGFTTTTQQLPIDTGVQRLVFHSGAIPALETATAQARSLVAVLAMFAAGPLGVAVAVLALGCRMIVERRRAALELLAARGASPGQLRRLLGLEGVIVGVLPATLGVAAGVALAAALFPESSALAPAAIGAAVLIAGLPPVFVVASATSSRRGRADAPSAHSRWRSVMEGIVVVLTVLATTLLVLRGTEAGAGAIDLLVIVAPLLLALTACIATLRLYPIVLRAVLARRQNGRGFVGVLGAARALRDPMTGAAPVLALVVGVAFAVASSILLSTVQTGADAVARASAGADMQLEALRFDADAVDTVADTEGVAAVAPVAVVRSAPLRSDDRRVLVSLYLVDRAQLDEVQQGYPPAVPADVALGDGSGPAPVLFSAGAAVAADAENAELTLVAADAEYAGTAAGVVPFASTPTWTLADAAYLPEIGDVQPVTVRLLVRVEPGADAEGVLVAIQERLGGAVGVMTAERALAELRRDPIAAGLRIVLLAGVAVSAVLAAVAVVATLVLGTRSRRRVFALLRTLGAPPRSDAALITWELAPALVAALAVGALLGAALPVLVMRVIDLRPFTGGVEQPGYALDPLILLTVVGGFLTATAVCTVIAVLVTRNSRIAAILRTVEDT